MTSTHSLLYRESAPLSINRSSDKMKMPAVMLLFAVGLSYQLQVSTAGLTFGTTGYFPKGKLCGSHYTFDLVLRTWPEARTFCRSQGGDLVSIETNAEQEYLKQVIAKNRHNPLLIAHVTRHSWFGFWTSGTDTEVEGKFVWTANGSPISLKHWTHGNPNNAGNNEDFLQFVAANGLWNDANAKDRIFSICEF